MNSPDFPDSLKSKLKLLDEIKRYAVDSLSLPAEDQYEKVFDQKGKDVLWVVTAAEPYELKSYTWQFPILGEVSYKGFFIYKEAEKEAEKQAEEARRLAEEKARERKEREEAEKAEKARKEKEAAERAEMERIMQEQLAKEQEAMQQQRRQHVLSEKERYQALIHQTIKRYLNADFKGKSCRLNIRLATTGLVTKVSVLDGDPALCRAAQSAVLRPDRLPVSDDPAVYEELKNINLKVEL